MSRRTSNRGVASRAGIFLFLAALAALLLPSLAQAAEEGVALKESQDQDWSVDLIVPYFSKYVSRGAVAVDDPVLQPMANLSGYGFTFNVWGNYNLTDKIGVKGKFSEVDLTGEYAFALGDFSFPVGVIHYLFPNMTQPNTTEVYAGVSYDALIKPSLKLYQDVGDAHGLLAALTLGWERELGQPLPGVSCSLLANAGLDWGSSDYNSYRYNWGVDGDRLIDYSISLGLALRIMEALTVTPSYTHMWLIDSAIKEAAGYDDKGFWGLSLTWSF